MNQHMRTAWGALRLAFFLGPFLAGLDKFFHLLTKIRNKHSEQLALLLLQQRVANLIFLVRKLLIGRILFVGNLQHGARRSICDRPADVANADVLVGKADGAEAGGANLVDSL